MPEVLRELENMSLFYFLSFDSTCFIVFGGNFNGTVNIHILLNLLFLHMLKA